MCRGTRRRRRRDGDRTRMTFSSCIDVQNDFCPGGALAVPDGDAVIEVIHRIAPRFEHIVLTQDWHPAHHSSFASAHTGRSPTRQIEMSYGRQTLWPDALRSRQQRRRISSRAQFAPGGAGVAQGIRCRRSIPTQHFLRMTAGRRPAWPATWRSASLSRVFLAGLAYDYCVGYSALDARRLGLPALIVRDGCRAIDLNGSVEKMDAEFARAGVAVIESAALSS